MFTFKFKGSFLIIPFLLFFPFLHSCSDLFQISIEGEKMAFLDTISVPKGFSEVEPISPKRLHKLMLEEKNKLKLVHIYTSWCSFGASLIDSIILLDTNLFKLYLVSGDLKSQKQTELLKKFLFSKGFYDKSFIMDFNLNIFDLKNNRNIEKFVKYFLPSYKIDNFPVTLLFDSDCNLIDTFFGNSIKFDSLLIVRKFYEYPLLKRNN